MRALVVFFDPDGARWEWALKPGFRHVFACIDDGNCWIMVDGRDGRPVVEVIQPSSYDLKAFYEEQDGYSVLEVERPDRALRSPIVTVNCVGLLKAHLCIRAPFAITPWQLYKHIERKQHEFTRIRGIGPSTTSTDTGGYSG